ncbi:hypothetical protein [Paractinoplanes atraurantiacus]|uniref:hypothetical protein n=1 Tax=Paractinoplanes atraurantiacus TaxID=1036182 RepID=UPI000BE4322A|nr:hypothetical protein [Actinoplanes atraurantiacus]
MGDERGSKEIEIERTLAAAAAEAAAANENEITSGLEVSTPAGAAGPGQQPVMDLVNDPFHRGIRTPVADPTVVAADQNGLRFGPFQITSGSAGTYSDYSFQAAGNSMLRFLYAALGTGVVSAATGGVLAEPSGQDLLLIGGATGLVPVLVGLGINISRLARRKR